MDKATSDMKNKSGNQDQMAGKQSGQQPQDMNMPSDDKSQSQG